MQPTSGTSPAATAAVSQDAATAGTARPDLTDPTSTHPARPQTWMSGLQPAEPGPGFDPSVAHPARVYAYWLGGKDHYPADRQAAEEVIRRRPQVVAGARANRAFLGRVVRYLAAECGIRQFLDIGTGTCASYCVPFKRLCGVGPGGAFAACLFGFGREGDGPAAGGCAAGWQVPVADPGVHGVGGDADACGYLAWGEFAVGEHGGGGDVVVVPQVGG